MSKKTIILILIAVSVGGCCLMGMGVLALGAMAPEEAPIPTASAAAPSPVVEGGDPSLGGYIIWGKATPTAEGFAESLVGNWLLMDGATSIESIQTISEDTIRVTNNRSGELWHFSFEDDGSYAFRYVLTVKGRAYINVEKGEWSSDGAQLTLKPSSCRVKNAYEDGDCNPGERTFRLTTVLMEEFTPRDHQQGRTWTGLRLTGQSLKFEKNAGTDSVLQLMRIR